MDAPLQGWVGVVRMILPAAAADANSIEEAVRSIEQLTQGIPLLHLAVRSQRVQLVRPHSMCLSRSCICPDERVGPQWRTPSVPLVL